MEEKEFMIERYELSIERIRGIMKEETVAEKYRDYFRKVAVFILEIDQIQKRCDEDAVRAGVKGTINAPVDTPIKSSNIAVLEAENRKLYEDILGEHYVKSYANPAYAVAMLGEDLGKLLSFLYTELRSEIVHVFEKKIDYLAIYNELFIEIYNCFEGVEEPDYKEIKSIIYWFVSDYCDVFLADRIEERLNPEKSFAKELLVQSDLSDINYLYQYGEYISKNELETAEHYQTLSQEVIEETAEVSIENFVKNLAENGVDFAQKEIVEIQYELGMERVAKEVIEKLESRGKKAVICRRPVSIFTKVLFAGQGYFGTVANQEYEKDHEKDQGIFLNKKLVERQLEVVKNTYEQLQSLAEKYAGVISISERKEYIASDGKENSSLEKKEAVISLSEKQETLMQLYHEKWHQLISIYHKK